MDNFGHILTIWTNLDQFGHIYLGVQIGLYIYIAPYDNDTDNERIPFSPWGFAASVVISSAGGGGGSVRWSMFDIFKGAVYIYVYGSPSRSLLENIRKIRKSEIRLNLNLSTLYGTWEALGGLEILPRGVGTICRHV